MEKSLDKTNKKRRNHIDHLDHMIPFLFANGCARAWLTLLFTGTSNPFTITELAIDPHLVFDIIYAICGALIAFNARKIRLLQSKHWAKFLACAGMLLASICYITIPIIPEARTAISIITLLAAIAGGIGFTLKGLLFAEALAPLSLARIAFYAASARFIAVPITFLCTGLEGIRLNLILLALPVVSVACVVYAFNQLPAEDKIEPAVPKFSFPWKPLALYAIYEFVYGLRLATLPAGAGTHSTLSTALVMGAFAILVYFFSDRFSISALYRSPLVLMVCGFLFIPIEGLLGATISGYLISMSITLISLLVSLLFYDLSKRLGLAIIALAGYTRVVPLFSNLGSACASWIDSALADSAMQSTIISAMAVMLILVATLMLLSEKELASRWGIRIFESTNLVDTSAKAERLADRCNALSTQGRLSPREDEILRLLAQGKSNTTIEKELFIASGTLKAHIQHIYVKLGIHSRKELAALVSVGEGGEGSESDKDGENTEK